MKQYYDQPIDKTIDWGGDTATGGLLVKGNRVQDFIKETLDGKAGYFYPDTGNNRYIVFTDEASYEIWAEDPTTHSDLVIATLPLPAEYSIRIELVDTPTIQYVKYGSTGNYYKANFKVVNSSGSDVEDAFALAITIKNGSAVQKINSSAQYGTTFSLNLDKYLKLGNNVITVQATASTYLISSSSTVTVNAIDLSVSDLIDISTVYGEDNPTLEAAVYVSGPGTKIIDWYLDDEQLAYNSETDTTSESSAVLTRYINVSNLSEGRHTLQYRAKVYSGDSYFYSDIAYRDIIVYHGDSNDTIVAVGFNYDTEDVIDPTEETLSIEGFEQFVSKDIKYAAFNPAGAALTPMLIAFLNNTTDYLTENNRQYVYTLKPFSSGTFLLSFTSIDTTVSFNVVIAQSSLNLNVISNTEFEFSGSERSNTSSGKDLSDWSFTGASGSTYTATMSGFDYTSQSGWGSEGLMFLGDAELAFDYAPLNYNITQSGGTFEFELSTNKVLDDDQVICDITNASGVGIKITATEASLTSNNGVRVYTKYKPEETVRITFVINPISGDVNKGLVFIFVNGILSGVKNYANGDSFLNSKTITIQSSSNAGIVLKQIRIYRRLLSLDQVLNNYILYRPTLDELRDLYDDNNIYDETGYNLATTKLLDKTPIIIVTGNMQKLQDFGPEDKGTYVKMLSLEVINVQDPTRDLLLEDVSIRCQGTSSMNYPKKNFRFYTQGDNKDKTVDSYTTKMYDADGTLIFGDDRLYSFKANAIPVDCWCLKADYAESSSTHNTGVARLWNNVLKNASIPNNDIDDRHYIKTEFPNTTTPCRTIAQQKALDNNYAYDVRTTVDGFPIVLFYHLTENDPLIFLGKYNWNNDKSTENVYGFRDIPGFDNENMECWEVINGDYPENLFTDLSNWTSTTSGEGWRHTFESRYPDDAGEASEAERAEGTGSALYRVASWINSTKDAVTYNSTTHKLEVADADLLDEFSTDKWDYLDVYKMAAYYIYLMRFGGVDQTVKNAMFTTEDGEHWYYINYDNDTILGLDNNGYLAFDYTIDRQTLDPRSSTAAFCYAGHNSVLWNNLEMDEEFMDIVKQVDQALFSAGLTYGNVIDIFNNEQSDKWSERLHNLDSQYKYLSVFILDGNTVGLDKLQGSRSAHRQWWLSNRFSLYDAKNATGAYRDNVVRVRVNTPESEVSADVTVTPYVSGQIYGYGKGGKPVASYPDSTVDVPITMTISDLYVGESIEFYNAVWIKSINLSELVPYITEVHFDSVNSDSFNSYLENLTLNNTSAENTTLLILGGLANFKYLKSFVAKNLKTVTSLDLSGNKYFESLDIRGCSSLGSVTFADAAPLQSIQLPAATTSLSFSNNGVPSTFTVEEYGKNISTINATGVNPFSNSTSFLFNWYTHRTSTSNLSVYIDNINWTNVNPTELIAFANYVKENGTLKLKGTARLNTSVSLTNELVNQLKELFGENCFGVGSEFRIIGSGVFITGPTLILSGDTALYTAYDVSGQSGNMIYLLAQSITGYSINRDTGLLTTAESTSSDTTVTILATFVPDYGETSTVTLLVVAKKIIYPNSSNVTLHGSLMLQLNQNIRFYWTDTTSGVNGRIESTWSVSGDAADYVQITSQLLYESNIMLTSIPEEGYASGTVTLTVKKASNHNTLFTKTFDIVAQDENIAFTAISSPGWVAALYNAELIANSNYATKLECLLITSQQLHDALQNYSSKSNIQNAEEFLYFRSVSTLLTGTFLGYEDLHKIVFPEGCTTIEDNAFKGSSSIYRFNVLAIYISSTVSTINTLAFNTYGKSTAVESLIVNENNTTYDSRNDCNAIIKTSTNTLIVGCKNTTIPNTVTRIDALYFNAARNFDLHEDITYFNVIDAVTNPVNNVISRSTTAPTIPNTNFFAGTGTLYYPNGSDYSSWRTGVLANETNWKFKPILGIYGDMSSISTKAGISVTRSYEISNVDNLTISNLSVTSSDSSMVSLQYTSIGFNLTINPIESKMITITVSFDADGEHKEFSFTLSIIILIGTTITIDNRESASNPSTKISGSTVCTAANTRKPGVTAENNDIAWIRDNSHRYIGKYVGGVFTIAQLSDTDSTKYADGTDAPITTLGNDVFVKLPEFWWKCEETTTDSDIWNIAFSNTQLAGWNHWDGKTFIGAYKTYEESNIPYSCSGKTFTINVSQQDFKSHAASKGSTYHLVTYEAHQIMCLLFYAYYGNTDSQSICGSEYVSSRTTGSSNSMGMTDSAKSGNPCVNFWGLEQWWGGRFEHIDNLKTTGSYNVGIYAPGTSMSETPIRTVKSVSGGNTIKLMLLGANGDVIYKSCTSSSSYNMYYSDYGNVYSPSNMIALRSGSDFNTIGGIAYLLIATSPSYAYLDYCSRLVCMPPSYTEISKF